MGGGWAQLDSSLARSATSSKRLRSCNGLQAEQSTTETPIRLKPPVHWRIVFLSCKRHAKCPGAFQDFQGCRVAAQKAEQCTQSRLSATARLGKGGPGAKIDAVKWNSTHATEREEATNPGELTAVVLVAFLPMAEQLPISSPAAQGFDALRKYFVTVNHNRAAILLQLVPQEDTGILCSVHCSQDSGPRGLPVIELYSRLHLPTCVLLEAGDDISLRFKGGNPREACPSLFLFPSGAIRWSAAIIKLASISLALS
jgi:hypothetical protein